MATFRMAASAGAVLTIALTAIVPVTAQAQGPGAPLELVPGPNQARPSSRAAIKNKNAAKPVAKAPAKGAAKATTKPTPKAAARTAPRQNTVAAQPAPKATRANAHTAAASPARNHLLTGPHAPLSRYAYPQPIIRAAVVPYVAMTRPVYRRGSRNAPVIARGTTSETPPDRVMRGRDSVSLVAMLPWWRNNRMQDVSYGSEAAESKVIEAAAVWLAAQEGGHQAEHAAEHQAEHAAATESDTSTRDVVAAPAPVRGPIEVADSGRINEIDRAARAPNFSIPSIPAPTFMQALLALIGGAMAAAVASARLLFR